MRPKNAPLDYEAENDDDNARDEQEACPYADLLEEPNGRQLSDLRASQEHSRRCVEQTWAAILALLAKGK